MKPRKKTVGQILDHALGRFSKVSDEDIESSREQALKYFESETGEAVSPSAWEPSAARRVSRSPWLVAASVAAAITVVVLLPTTIAAPAVMQDGLGSRKITYGEIVRPMGESGGTLKLIDGTLVEVRAMSELSLEPTESGVRIRLNRGSVIVNTAKDRSGNLYVQTKDMSARGNAFLVNAEEEGSRVVGIGGETRVQQGVTETKLLPGEHVESLRQSSAPEAFEVVSIRPADPNAGAGRGAAGGGMSILPSGCGGRYPIQIDPRRFAVYGTTLHVLVTWAYGSGKFDYQSCRDMSHLNLISGGPGWVRSASDLWDLEAIIPEGALDYTQEQLKKGDAPKLRKMLQAVLADRFKLVMRSESKEIPAYALTAENGAPRLTVRPEIDTPDFREMLARQSPGILLERGLLFVKNAPMADFIPLLERDINASVLDRTGLTGQYSFLIEYTPLERLNSGGTPFAGPSFFNALPEQVGLKLEKTKPVTRQAWIIESAQKPTEN